MNINDFENLVSKVLNESCGCGDSCECESCSNDELVSEHIESREIIRNAFPQFEKIAKKVLKSDDIEADSYVREVGEGSYEVTVYDTNSALDEVVFTLHEDLEQETYTIELLSTALVNGQKFEKQIKFPYILTFGGKFKKV